jgi:hypothetical protein
VHQGQRVRTRAMVPLPLGRVIEERITSLESLRDAKHWLGVIARAEEADYVDLSTVKVLRSILPCFSPKPARQRLNRTLSLIFLTLRCARAGAQTDHDDSGHS